MSEISKLAITKFDPNPYQPRTRVDVSPETAEFYGKSILEHGLLQTPLARPAPFGKKGDRYEMGDGWLRLQGFKWLVEHGHTEYQEIPVEIREIKDEAMAQLVFEANGVRKQLSPIETAQYFKKYMDNFKVTEAELAKKHSISQGEVANTMRLLQLPTEIQYLVGNGSIPQTHARHLLRLNIAPEVQKNMVQAVVKGSTSVNALSEAIDQHFWRNSKSLNPKTDSWEKPKFDLGVCQGCVNRVNAAEPYGQHKKEDRCILVSCWDKKQKEAADAEIKKAIDASKGKSGQKILTSTTIKGEDYAALEPTLSGDNFDHSACRTCENTALYKYRLDSDDKPVKICLNPSCMRAKKSAFSRDKNKKDKLLDAELTETLGKVFHLAHNHPAGVMMMVIRHSLTGLRAEAKRDIARVFPNLPKIDNGQLNNDGIMAGLVKMSLEDLTDLAAAITFSAMRRNGYEQFSTVIKDDLKFDLAQIDGTAKTYITELTEWQEANCRGCNLCTDALIGSGLECCHQTYNKQIQKDGTCKYSPKSLAKKAEETQKQDAAERKATAAAQKAPSEPATSVQTEAKTVSETHPASKPAATAVKEKTSEPAELKAKVKTKAKVAVKN